jgi:hypothetical protein
MSPADLGGRFPRLGDFAELVRRYDPTGKFENPLLLRVFND